MTRVDHFLTPLYNLLQYRIFIHRLPASPCAQDIVELWSSCELYEGVHNLVPRTLLMLNPYFQHHSLLVQYRTRNCGLCDESD
jgi:hypothetical protein